MKLYRMIFPVMLIFAMTYGFAGAAHHTPEERGKTLFNDQKFAGGEKACGECHKNGSGLEGVADKKEFSLMGKEHVSIEEAVNICIVNANRGKAIDVTSGQMKDIVAYIRSLKATKKEMHEYKESEHGKEEHK